MPAVQIRQQHLAVPLPALVLRDIVPPTPDRAGQAPRHAWLVADLGDGVEVGADGEDDAAGAGESAEGLPLRAEVVVLDGLVFEGCGPRGGAVFGADGAAPGEAVVDLDEVVVLGLGRG
jgi:hypothetical protein